MSPITISSLVNNLAVACRALIPALDCAAVPWREGTRYDNWERIEEVLFKSLVAEPCEHEASVIGEYARFAPYGFKNDDQQANAKNNFGSTCGLQRSSSHLTQSNASEMVRRGLCISNSPIFGFCWLLRRER